MFLNQKNKILLFNNQKQKIMEIMESKQIMATKENVELAINNIKKYAEEKGYQIKGEFKQEGFLSSLFGSSKITFESKSKEKVCRNYLWRLEKKMGMSIANRFLHFLYKKTYKLEQAPKVDYSDKEIKIQEARKAWKKLQKESELLMAAYKAEKKDFYKVK